MSPRLPVTSGNNAIKVFQKIGYQTVRQRGSHIRMRHTDPSHKPLTIPVHKELKPGLLRKLLRDSGLSVEEFVKLLK